MSGFTPGPLGAFPTLVGGWQVQPVDQARGSRTIVTVTAKCAHGPDALLYAAAPEMYAALQAITDYFDEAGFGYTQNEDGSYSDPALHRVVTLKNAALAKAEGKS